MNYHEMKIAEYFVLDTIQENGENANVYLVENRQSQKYIIKQFSKKVMPFIGYAKYNHFGRRREGAEKVFQEIKKASLHFPFLTQFHHRFKWKNKWHIVIEYFEGETINRFLEKNRTDFDKTFKCIKNFALEVALWHRNGFAHGDPHLENALINPKTLEVKLVDYSQIHHEHFYCCEMFSCFHTNDPLKRFREDLENDSKMGRGFLFDLKKMDKKYHFKKKMSSFFEEIYTSNSPVLIN